ncbi:MAG: Ig domain-containing protein [Bacillota bacterium]|nr:Ig domain-containing protein [Bacillota bacterium]
MKLRVLAAAIAAVVLMFGPGQVAAQAAAAEAPPIVNIQDTVFPPAIIGQPYSVQLQVYGGKPPYTWTADRLPTGLHLDSSGRLYGVISSATGNATDVISVKVTDAQGETAYASFNLAVWTFPDLPYAAPAPTGIPSSTEQTKLPPASAVLPDTFIQACGGEGTLGTQQTGQESTATCGQAPQITVFATQPVYAGVPVLVWAEVISDPGSTTRIEVSGGRLESLWQLTYSVTASTQVANSASGWTWNSNSAASMDAPETDQTTRSYTVSVATPPAGQSVSIVLPKGAGRAGGSSGGKVWFTGSDGKTDAYWLWTPPAGGGWIRGVGPTGASTTIKVPALKQLPSGAHGYARADLPPIQLMFELDASKGGVPVTPSTLRTALSAWGWRGTATVHGVRANLTWSGSRALTSDRHQLLAVWRSPAPGQSVTVQTDEIYTQESPARLVDGFGSTVIADALPNYTAWAVADSPSHLPGGELSISLDGPPLLYVGQTGGYTATVRGDADGPVAWAADGQQYGRLSPRGLHADLAAKKRGYVDIAVQAHDTAGRTAVAYMRVRIVDRPALPLWLLLFPFLLILLFLVLLLRRRRRRKAAQDTSSSDSGGGGGT